MNQRQEKHFGFLTVERIGDIHKVTINATNEIQKAKEFTVTIKPPQDGQRLADDLAKKTADTIMNVLNVLPLCFGHIGQTLSISASVVSEGQISVTLDAEYRDQAASKLSDMLTMEGIHVDSNINPVEKL